jgi:homoserine dehydrogenase
MPDLSKPQTPKPLRIAIAGLGTVGIGVMRLLEENRAEVEARAGRPVTVTAVNARDKAKDRGFEIPSKLWADDMAAMAAREDVDLVAELVGGSEGPALELAKRTLGAGKGFVTANKAMIAHHGLALARLAETHAAPLKFEAAVAGGIPVVKGLREGASANRIERIYGILNGTCNFILSEMESSGADFADVLAEAQAKGYAEADPSFDVGGVDAAHKLAILASIGFGGEIDFGAVTTTGITQVSAADIEQAKALGFVIRLIGVADCDVGPLSEAKAPRLLQRVRPCLVPRSHPLAHVTGATNAVVAEGNFVGRLLFQGAGAGEGPTASAVVADIIDIARGDNGPPFSLATHALKTLPAADPGGRIGRDYIRFTVSDKPGVLAEITAAMRDADVSIESLIQQGSSEGGEVLLAIVTHEGPERCVSKALDLLNGSPSLTAEPLVLPILRD